MLFSFDQHFINYTEVNIHNAQCFLLGRGGSSSPTQARRWIGPTRTSNCLHCKLPQNRISGCCTHWFPVSSVVSIRHGIDRDTKIQRSKIERSYIFTNSTALCSGVPDSNLGPAVLTVFRVFFRPSRQMLAQ
jgi:hypothetical protein